MMSKKSPLYELYLPVKARCFLCDQPDVFALEDPLLLLSIHQICLELLAANLPAKTAKIIMEVVERPE
jgi:hypothetical protein